MADYLERFREPERLLGEVSIYVGNNQSDVLAVIPARWGSTRFPGKPIAKLSGHPVVEHVYRRALRARLVSRVVVATDDDRIADEVRAFGGEVCMTRADHPSGTDRVAEVAAADEYEKFEFFVNVQGDEPLIHPEDIDAAVRPMLGDSPPVMSTLGVPIREVEDFLDPNVVKVVVDGSGDALYFSRSPIPYFREVCGMSRVSAEILREHWEELQPRPVKHLGLYVYRKNYLLRLASLSPSPFEQAEGLEQLRFLEDGARIRVIQIENDSIGVDVPEDLARLHDVSALRAVIEQEVGQWPNTSS